MNIYDACATIEGFDGQEHSHEDIVAAFQVLIDSGMIWTLQGWYSREAEKLVKSGECHA